MPVRHDIPDGTLVRFRLGGGSIYLFDKSPIRKPRNLPSKCKTGFSPVDVAYLRLAHDLWESLDVEDDDLDIVMQVVDR